MASNNGKGSTIARETEPALLLSVAEAARLLGIGATLAWKLVQAGEIPTVRLGKRVLVPRSAVEQIVSGASGH